MRDRLRVAAVVEWVWDPASIELTPGLEGVDWRRAVAGPGPGSLEAVELGLGFGEVTACATGGAADRVLRRARAMGASAVRAPDPASLAALLAREAFDLVLVPWRSGHQGPSPLAPLLAGSLRLPQATAVDWIAVDGDRREATVNRRLDRGGREELVLPLPAVIALEPGLIRPRTASPAAEIAAMGEAIPVAPPVSGTGLGRSGPGGIRFLGYQAPRPPPPRTRLPDAPPPAEARIAAIVATARSAGPREMASGPADELAERALRFLVQGGYGSWRELPRRSGSETDHPPPRR